MLMLWTQYEWDGLLGSTVSLGIVQVLKHKSAALPYEIQIRKINTQMAWFP